MITNCIVIKVDCQGQITQRVSLVCYSNSKSCDGESCD